MACDRGIYSIGAISRMLGLSQPAIRSWEERYGVVVAERSERERATAGPTGGERNYGAQLNEVVLRTHTGARRCRR